MLRVFYQTLPILPYMAVNYATVTSAAKNSAEVKFQLSLESYICMDGKFIKFYKN